MHNEQVIGLEPTWAVIELFGHAQIAGKLSTVTLSGSVLLKVEVPETVRETTESGYFEGTRQYGRIAKVETRTPAYPRLFGVGAIYAINPCTEAIARSMAKRISDSEVARLTSVETRTALPPPAPIEVDMKSLGAGTPEAENTTASGEDLCGFCNHMRKEHDERYGCQVTVEGDGCFCGEFELQEKKESQSDETIPI